MDLYKRLPKAELHAHLHGCVRISTLAELLCVNCEFPSAAHAIEAIEKALTVSFRVFGLIHRAVCSETAVRRVTREAVDDFESDGVDYLELRTTPRVLEANAAVEDIDGAERYLLCVLGALAVREAQSLPGGIVVRLLLSVNRTAPLDAAERIVQLAMKYLRVCFRVSAEGEATACLADSCAAGDRVYGPYIVGIDLSGDPSGGSAVTFFPVLSVARAAGLRISVHAGEVMNVAEAEAVLDWRPDRLGHMCALAPLTAARLLATAKAVPIPVETCPFGNTRTLRLPSLAFHPTLPSWMAAGYPVAVCTDNPGVYGITSSSELRAVATEFRLGPRAVADLALGAFRAAFLSDVLRERLVAAAEAKAALVLSEWTSAGCEELLRVRREV
jgi:adenosine deaminase